MAWTPTAVFNGLDLTVGAETPGQYMNTVLDQSMVPAPIRINVDSFDPSSGAVNATVTMYSTTLALTNASFYFILIEDNVAGVETHVTRDLYVGPISLTGADNTAAFNTTFTINPSWNTANLRVVAFVQLQNKTIIQAASTYPQPSFNARPMVPVPVEFGPATGTTATEPFVIMNTGLGDTYTIELVLDEAPAGWQIDLVDHLGAILPNPHPFSLTSEESAEFRFNVTPISSGRASFHVIVDSTSLASPRTARFDFFTDDLDAIVVDDDGVAAYENYFTEALDAGGMKYSVWDRNNRVLPAGVVENCNLLIWNAGFANPTLKNIDRATLAQYLGNGGALFLSGQDVGWELNSSPTVSSNTDPVWYQTYLHATYIRDDTNIMDLFGVTGDPITAGLDLHIAGGTGASNQTYPDEIAAADADATEILHYTGGFCGAVRSTDSVSGAKVVYLGFGFEGIDNAQDRHDLLIPSLRWLETLFQDGFESGDTSAWTAATP